MSSPHADATPSPDPALPSQHDASLAPEPTPDASVKAGSRSQMTGAAIALLLLCIAIWVAYGPLSARNQGAEAVFASANPELIYTSDLDFWQRTPRETTVLATAHFDLDHSLADVPMQVGSWTGERRPETNQEVLILLEPEQYEQRLYRDADGFPIWLSLVGGRSSQPFHAPDICYDADGWQYSLGSYPVTLAQGGSIWGLYLTAHKDEADPNQPGNTTRVEHVVFYFYLFPDDGRALEDGIVLFKLTSSRAGTVEETLERHADFVRQFFTHAAARNGSISGMPPVSLAPHNLPRL